jgi:hypothetical protein
MERMRVGVKSTNDQTRNNKADTGRIQSNTLLTYFKKNDADKG